MRRVAERQAPKGRVLSARLSQIYGYHIVYPSDDHIIEFYPFLTQVQGGPKNLPYGMYESLLGHGYETGKPTAAPAEPEVRAEFFKEYQALLDEIQLPDLHRTTRSPAKESQASSVPLQTVGVRSTLSTSPTKAQSPTFPPRLKSS